MWRQWWQVLDQALLGWWKTRSLPNVSDVSILISLRCGLPHNAEPPGTTGPSFCSKAWNFHCFEELLSHFSQAGLAMNTATGSDLRLHISRKDLFNGSNWMANLCRSHRRSRQWGRITSTTSHVIFLWILHAIEFLNIAIQDDWCQAMNK